MLIVLRSMKDIEYAKELLNIISKEKIIIYGTGFVAERFLRILERNNLVSQIQCFVTSDSYEQDYKGFSLYSIESLPPEYKDLHVCIAVHESNLKQIEDLLVKKNYQKAIWIYPYIYDLWYGEPIEKNKIIKVSQLIKKCDDDYRIPIRLLVIEQYYGKNDVGYEIYIKSQSIHSSKATAKARLNKFIELINSWDKIGFDNTYRLKITNDNEIFDGIHRLALAYYHGLKNIECDVYNANDIEDYLNNEIKITKDAIEKGSLNREEISLLDHTLSKLKL